MREEEDMEVAGLTLGICGKLFVSFESVQAPVNGTGDRECECDGRERRKEVVEHADSGVVKRTEEKQLCFQEEESRGAGELTSRPSRIPLLACKNCSLSSGRISCQ